jgi:hypothetical protein
MEGGKKMEDKELEKMIHDTTEQVKLEHAKILKMLKENDTVCFADYDDEDSVFNSMEEYSIAIGTLANCVTYMLQLKQSENVLKAQKNNVIQLEKNAKEAKK